MSTIRSEGRREGEKGKETGEVSANNWCPIQLHNYKYPVPSDEIVKSCKPQLSKTDE